MIGMFCEHFEWVDDDAGDVGYGVPNWNKFYASYSLRYCNTKLTTAYRIELIFSSVGLIELVVYLALCENVFEPL